jgi:putative transposase
MAYKVSQRRACSTLVFARSVVRYESRADPQTALRMRLRELAMARVGYGYRRLHVLLGREGWRVNHKRVYRLISRRRTGNEEEDAQAAQGLYETGAVARSD